MKYTCTRDASRAFSASEAIVMGISDGGLIVPSSFPKLDASSMKELAALSYPERVAKVLSMYLDGFSYDELAEYCEKAYLRFEDDPCPIVKIENGLYMLELWHGPTCSVEDMPYMLFPYLLSAAKAKIGRENKPLALIAANGDGCAAALEGTKGIDGIETVAFYPTKGVSLLQRLQITVQKAKNVHAAGVVGGYDGVRVAVGNVIADDVIKAELANIGCDIVDASSANIGIVLPQIAHYISAYCDLVDGEEIEFGEKVNFAVSAGDFTGALAGYYAYRMGLPINKIIVASNANNAVSDLFWQGIFDIRRDFFKTMSPSMDMLVPRNLERLIFEAVGQDSALVRRLYGLLKSDGRFEIDTSAVRADIFEAGWADEEETKETIYAFFDLDDYIMDTHTAVAASVYNEYSCAVEDETPTVIFSVASPFKFAQDVLCGLGVREKDVYKAISRLQAFTALECADSLLNIFTAEEVQKTVVDLSEVGRTAIEFMGKV